MSAQHSASDPSHGREEQAEADGSAQESSAKMPPVSPPAPPAKRSPVLPAWVSSNIGDPHSLKMLLRCWLASWSTLVLILPQSSLAVLGQAAFFAMLLTFMIPANMPVSLFLLANLMIVLGSCLGWAWSAAAMAASLRARNQVLLQQQLQTTYASVSGATNPDALFQAAIFQGTFLDVNSTVVFGVFLVVGAYLSGVLQAKLPKLKIASIFLLILLDIMCSYGPLFPFAQYTLATILLIPIGCSVAISLACQLLIFPETLNTAWQRDLIKILGLARSTIATHQSAMERMLHEDPGAVEAELDPKIREMHVGLIGLADAMGGQRGFLELEVTYGRLSGKDLGEVYVLVRTMLVRMFGLNAFFHLLERYGQESKEQDEGPVAVHDTHAILRFRRHVVKSETEANIQLESLLPVLVDASRRTLKALDECLLSTSDWLEASVHRRRSYNHDEWLKRLEAAGTELQDALHAFVSHDRLALLQPYMHLFHGSEAHLSPESQQHFRVTARPLFVCLVFAANLTHFAEALLTSHTAILALVRKRSRNKVWFPTGLRKIGKILTSRKPAMGTAAEQVTTDGLERYTTEDSHDNEHEDDDNNDDKQPQVTNAGRPERLDPDALPPSHAIHHVGRLLSASYRFAWSPASVYGLRFAVVTFALWIPAVLPSTANFIYVNRGLWALIMGQTGLALSGGELVFSLGGRLIGTLTGLVLGMLYWYMSCGRAAQGNPYGLAAVCAVGFLPIVFFRIFAPPMLLLPAIMTGVTAALCVGYSWIDANLVVQANSGIGYEVAWRRALLVIIGMFAAFLVTIFPRPPSTRRMVRHGFATSADGIARLYSIIVEAWIIVEASDEEKEAPRQGRLSPTLRARFIAAQALLAGLNRDIGLATLDVSFRGQWPKAKYTEMLVVHARLLEAIAQMASALTGLDVEWRRKMLHTTAILDPKMISEISMTLHLLANALRTAQPLPHASTMLLESTILSQWGARNIERTLQAHAGSNADLLTLDTMRDAQFMKHTAAVMAILTFVSQLDRFRALVRDLVGEVDLPGYDELKRHHDQRLVQAHLA